MLNVDRVWSRISQLNLFKGKRLTDYIIQNVNQTFTLTSGQVTNQQAVNFPGGAVILGIGAAARMSAQAASQTQSPGLDMFAVAIDFQQTSRSIVGTAKAMGSAVFGPFGDQFPGKELIVPVQGALLYSVENLTTSTILVHFSHACLVPNAVG